MYKFQTTEYKLNTQEVGREVCFAVVSDLHSRKGTQIDGIISKITERKPDYVLMPGDIFERLDGTAGEDKQAGLELMERLSARFPVIYSIGNHENGGIGTWNIFKWSRIESIPKYYDGAELERIKNAGAVILDDDIAVIDGIAFCGLTSGIINKSREPDLTVIERLCQMDCKRVLLCHHPEYYKKYLKDKNIDLIVSGHAHGGQWRIFGRGVFAPNQGLFPQYTSGVHDGRLVISRGLVRSKGLIPRIFNRPELVFVTFAHF